MLEPDKHTFADIYCPSCHVCSMAANTIDTAVPAHPASVVLTTLASTSPSPDVAAVPRKRYSFEEARSILNNPPMLSHDDEYHPIGSFGIVSSCYSELIQSDSDTSLVDHGHVRNDDLSLQEIPSTLEQVLRQFQLGGVMDLERNHYSVCEVHGTMFKALRDDGVA